MTLRSQEVAMTDSVQLDQMSPGGIFEISAGAPRSYRGLTVFPLISEPRSPLPYDLLLDAIGEGSLKIREVRSGTVPNLLAHNVGTTDVLILDGEQLIGARQNRITNRSILLAAGAKTEIPVSCMEQGRWHFTSEEFAPAPKARHAPTNVRRHAKFAEMEVAVATGRGRRDSAAMAQGQVWNSISELSDRLGGRSDTGAMDEVYDHLDTDLESWLAHFPSEPGQVGLLAFLGSRPLAIDALGCSELWARVHRRFLGGYVMDALAWQGGATAGSTALDTPDEHAAEIFLAAVAGARRIESDTVGSGTYRVLAGAAIGGELIVDGVGDPRLVHLSAFPSDDDRRGTRPVNHQDEGSPLAPPSRRRST
jgi:hypothetical protein